MKFTLILILTFVTSFSAWARELVIISDLDETLRMANVEKKGKAFLKLVAGVKPYPGLVKIFNDIKANNPEAKFYYLSNSYNFLYNGNRWVRKMGLPEGVVLQRRLLKDKSNTFKPKQLRLIVDNHPGARFMLFGDNIERDTMFYVSLVTERRLSDAAIYIRDARLIFPQVENVTFYQSEVQILDDLNVTESVRDEITQLPFYKLVPNFLFNNLWSRLFISCENTTAVCLEEVREKVRQVREELEHDTYAGPLLN